MAPKKAAGKAKSSSSSHASYQDMIKLAILNLKERKGSSRQAIKKYIRANNSLGNTTDAAFNSHINRALSAGEEQGIFERPKGPSGPVKLKKPAATASKPAATKSATKPAAAKKTAAAKPAAKKAAAAGDKKKPAAKKTATKKSAVAKQAPAVVDKPAVATGKTKSGRVTKSKAPSTAKKVTKKPATKKAPAKKATPKKEAAAA